MALVYRIVCLATGKMYVGWTARLLEDRWQRHLRLDKKCYLANCIRAYGADAFRVETLADGLTADEAKTLEVRLIREMGLNMCRYPDGPGMNMTNGGEGTIGYIATESHRKNLSISNKGRKHSPSALEAMSVSKQGERNPMFGKPSNANQREAARKTFMTNNPHKPGKDSHRYGKPSHMRGKSHTEEAKRKMSEKLRGRKRRKRTCEERKKMSATMKRYLAEHGHPCLGKKASPESRERMRQARLARLAKEVAEGFKRRNTPETIEKMKAAAKRRVERQKAVQRAEMASENLHGGDKHIC